MARYCASRLRINIHLAVLEGRMEGFLAAASAFGSGAKRSAKLIEVAPKERSSPPPVQRAETCFVTRCIDAGEVGARVRAMMPWIGANELVDKDKS